MKSPQCSLTSEACLPALMSIHPLITSSHPHTSTHTHTHTLSLVQVCMCVCFCNRISDLQFIYGPLLSESLTTCQHPQTTEHYNDDTHTHTHTHKISIQQYTFIVLVVWQGNSHLITLPLQSSAEVLPLVSLRPLFSSHHCSTIRWMLLHNRDSQVDKHMERSVSYENIPCVFHFKARQGPFSMKSQYFPITLPVELGELNN